MMGLPLIVELTGARGVGKSTFAGLFRAELTRRDVPLYVDSKRGLVDTITLRLAGTAAVVQVERRWRSWGVVDQKALRVYRQRFRRYQLQTRRYSGETGILLLDEGVFQLMMMIGIRTGYEISRIERSLSEFVPMPDLVISVEAPEEAIEARRRQRGNAGDLLKPRMSHRSKQGLRSIQAYLRSLSDEAKPKLLVVNNGDYAELKSAAEVVAGEVVKKLSVRTGPVATEAITMSTGDRAGVGGAGDNSSSWNDPAP